MLLVLTLALSASPLAEAQQDYGNLDYESCVAKLTGGRGVGPKERARAELLLGLCHFALGHEAAARAQLEAAFRRDPAVVRPPNVSPKERALLEEVAAAVAASPAPPEHRVKRPAGKRPAEPKEEEGASKPPEVAVSPPPEPPPAPPPLTTSDAPTVAPSVVPASAPDAPAAVATAAPRRGPWLPWAAGGLAVAAVGTGVALGINARSLEAAGQAAPVQLDAARLRTQAQGNALGANVAFAVAGTAAATAVVSWLLMR